MGIGEHFGRYRHRARRPNTYINWRYLEMNTTRYVVIFALAIVSTLAVAGPNEIRAQAMFNALNDDPVPAQQVTNRIDAGMNIYGAWLPMETVVIGQQQTGETCDEQDPPVCTPLFEDVTQQVQADPSTWTGERRAGFYLRSLLKEVRQRTRATVEAAIRTSREADTETAVRAAGEAAEPSIE